MRELAKTLRVSREAVRQQLMQLQLDGFVTSERASSDGVGRPTSFYTLTRAGDHLFPKRYDDLAVAVLDAVSGELGGEALRAVLNAVVNARVEQWRPRLEGLSLPERLEALRDVYVEGDPFARVEPVEGGYRLIERNCPFLNVAMERPALCSVTVNTLARLLGHRVVREQRFQDGHGQCVFKVLVAEPAAPRSDFVLEGEEGEVLGG